MQKAKAVKPGSTIGVIAPASDVQEEALLRGVTELRHQGFRVVLSDGVTARHRYFAGSHEQRAREFMRMFEDPEIDAIFCARGGYGCIHLLQHLKAQEVRRFPKVFMGYSDVTVLLQFLEQQCQMVCFHGPMVAREFGLGEPFYDAQNLLACLSNTVPGLQITSPRAEVLRSGVVQGLLTGGCLSLLTALVGTSYEIQTRDCILFVEDVNAKPYQVDRMLMQLKLAGKFESVRGVIFGEMLDCRQGQEQDYQLQDIIVDILREFDFPIIYGFPSGHTSSGALTLPFGVSIQLNTEGRFILLEEGAVV
jgi:muramoyltetrapeptide carboxypeptidase